MAELVFRLRGAPEDEAQDIRDLLDEKHIDWYETSAGNWGISMPGIWIVDSDQKDYVMDLIRDYQMERYVRVRSEYEELKRQGKQRTFITLIRENPGQFVLYLLVIVGVLYLSIKPFASMLGD